MAKRYTLGRTATRWFVVLMVAAMLGMAIWTTVKVHFLSSDPETQERLQELKDQLQ